MDNIDVDKLDGLLRIGEVTVTFTKHDGSQRVMRCTKDFDLIPPDHYPDEYDGLVHIDLMKVFDLEIQEWRSFKPSRVISYE